MGGGYLAVGKKIGELMIDVKVETNSIYGIINISPLYVYMKKNIAPLYINKQMHVSQMVWVLPSEILCGSGCCAVEWTVDWNPGGGFCVVGQPAESENQWFTLLHVSFITQQ